MVKIIVNMSFNIKMSYNICIYGYINIDSNILTIEFILIKMIFQLWSQAVPIIFTCGLINDSSLHNITFALVKSLLIFTDFSQISQIFHRLIISLSFFHTAKDSDSAYVKSDGSIITLLFPRWFLQLNFPTLFKKL